MVDTVAMMIFFDFYFDDSFIFEFELVEGKEVCFRNSRVVSNWAKPWNGIAVFFVEPTQLFFRREHFDRIFLYRGRTVFGEFVGGLCGVELFFCRKVFRLGGRSIWAIVFYLVQQTLSLIFKIQLADFCWIFCLCSTADLLERRLWYRTDSVSPYRFVESLFHLSPWNSCCSLYVCPLPTGIQGEIGVVAGFGIRYIQFGDFEF